MLIYPAPNIWSTCATPGYSSKPYVLSQLYILIRCIWFNRGTDWIYRFFQTLLRGVIHPDTVDDSSETRGVSLSHPVHVFHL